MAVMRVDLGDSGCAHLAYSAAAAGVHSRLVQSDANQSFYDRLRAAPSRAAGPTARSRERPSRGFARVLCASSACDARGRGSGSRHSRAAAGRSPARRLRAPRRTPPSSAPRVSSASFSENTRRSSTASGGSPADAASTSAMIRSAATSRQCLQDRGMERADIGEMPVEAAARDAHRLRQRLGLQRREALSGERLQTLVEPVLRGKLIAHAAAPYTTVLTGASAGPILPYSTCMEGSRCAISCCKSPASWRSWSPLIHGVLAETRIFARADHRAARLRTLLRLVWQARHVAWIGGGVLLIAAPWMASDRGAALDRRHAGCVFGFAPSAMPIGDARPAFRLDGAEPAGVVALASPLLGILTRRHYCSGGSPLVRFLARSISVTAIRISARVFRSGASSIACFSAGP